MVQDFEIVKMQKWQENGTIFWVYFAFCSMERAQEKVERCRKTVWGVVGNKTKKWLRHRLFFLDDDYVFDEHLFWNGILSSITFPATIADPAITVSPSSKGRPLGCEDSPMCDGLSVLTFFLIVHIFPPTVTGWVCPMVWQLWIIDAPPPEAELGFVVLQDALLLLTLTFRGTRALPRDQ